MSEIKPVHQQRREFDEWEDIPKDTYDMRVNGKYQVRILYPAAAYEALQKENERLKVDLYGMQEAKKARFNISKANQEEAHKLLNEACDDNAMKQQTIISLKYEIDGMHDLNAAQANRIEELLKTNNEQDLLIKSLMSTAGLLGSEAQAKRIAHLEYKIDELMLEWCPDEMTQEQLENYANHQRKASL